MELAELRDLVIVIFAVLGSLAAIVIVLLAFILFRKVTPILNSAKGTVNEIKGTSSLLSHTVVKPVSRAVGFASGVRTALGIIMRLSRRKGEKRREQ